MVRHCEVVLRCGAVSEYCGVVGYYGIVVQCNIAVSWCYGAVRYCGIVVRCGIAEQVCVMDKVWTI